MIRTCAFLSLPVVLLGCVEPGADPCATANRDINLGSLITASASGSYDKCLDSIRAEIASIQLENRELQLKADAARRESASLSAEKKRLLDEEAALRRDISRLSTESAPDPAEVARVKERQRELNRRFSVVFG
ncbi:MAG: hypothetical protein OIF47_05090 [Marinibacterium sp.]|nr:hypothetical protein [Marinibacterium sp.]